MGGEKKYKPPPLPKGEILGGVAGILENDVYRTRPRALDLYVMYYDTQGKGEKERKGASLNNKTDPFDMSNLSSSYGPRTTETLIEAIFNPVPSHSEKPSPFTYYVPLEKGNKRSPITPTTTNGFNTSPNSSDGNRRKASIRSTATSSEYASVHSNSTSGGAQSLSSQSGHSYSSNGHSSEFGVNVDGEEKQKSWWRKIGTASVGHSRPGTPAM